MNRAASTFAHLCLLILTLLPLGCGGGGGDEGVGKEFFGGAAYVKVKTSPETVDIGGRTMTTIEVDSIHPGGIILKVRFPDALSYVPRSSVLRAAGKDFRRDPDIVTDDTDGNRFLVYFLSRNELMSDDEGTVAFELEGDTRLPEGRIEVDPDVNDIDTPDDVEFTVSDPQFDQEAHVEIDVRDR